MADTQLKTLSNLNIISLNDYMKNTNSNNVKTQTVQKTNNKENNGDTFVSQNQNNVISKYNLPQKRTLSGINLKEIFKGVLTLAVFYFLFFSMGRIFNKGLQRGTVNNGENIKNNLIQQAQDVWQDVTNAKSLDELALPDVLKKSAEDIIYKINHAKEYFDKGGTQKNAILFYGPPGTGKTTFAKAISKNFSNSRFASIDLSRMQGIYVGQTESNLNEAIDEICKYADNNPAQKIFAFIDEIDSFATEDNTSNVRYNAGVLNTLKKCLSEKLMTRDNVIIMAATNNDISSKSGNFSLPILDRFDQRIKVDNPSKSQIAKAISLHYKDKPQVAQYLKDETSKEVQEIAQELSNQNGSFRTLETVYNIAATVNKESNTLTFDDVLDAIKQMRFEEGNIRKTKIGFNS